MKKIHNALNADHFTRITCSNYNQISLEQNGVTVHRQRSAFSALAEAEWGQLKEVHTCSNTATNMWWTIERASVADESEVPFSVGRGGCCIEH